MGRLELLFTSFTNSLQPRRNVQSSHVKGFNKARGMLLVIGVGHREAKSYKAQLPSGALTFFSFCVVATSAHLVHLSSVVLFARLVFSSFSDIILADGGGCLELFPLPTCFSVDYIPEEWG